MIHLLALILGAEPELPPVPQETHGPGKCAFCGKRSDWLKASTRGDYCRRCAPLRETDDDWPADYRAHKAREHGSNDSSNQCRGCRMRGTMIPHDKRFRCVNCAWEQPTVK